MSSEYRTIPLTQLEPGEKFQFRVSPYNLDALIESITKEGQRVPILVRQRPDGRFDLLAGFNRVAALRAIGRSSVEAKIYLDIDDEKAIQISILDNIERQDLTPWDIVYAAAQLRDQGKKNEDIGKLLKDVTTRTVQRYLKVSHAPPDFKNALMAAEITIQQAYEALTRGIPLSSLKGRGRSVRDLRQMSRNKKTKAKTVVYRRTRKGGFIFRAIYRPGEEGLDDLIQKSSDFLNTLLAERSQLEADKKK